MRFKTALRDLEKTHEMQGLYDWQASRIKLALRSRQFELIPKNPARIQIVGTNGKGSTAFFLQQLLMHQGFKTGLFISPHLVNINERIRVNNELISDKAFAKIYTELYSHFKAFQLSYFEKLFLIAHDYFYQQNCEFEVWETGLGGRLDAVTKLGAPYIVYTKIGLDHQRLLGNTLKKITLEKAVAMEWSRKVFSTKQRRSVSLILSEHAETHHANLIEIEPPKRISITEKGTYFTTEEWGRFFLPMYGKHYAENAHLALHICQHILEEHNIKAARAALKQAIWPGRLQVLTHNNSSIILCGAHNADSLKADGEALQKLLVFHKKKKKRLAILTSFSGDRPLRKLLPLLKECIPQTKITTHWYGCYLPNHALSDKNQKIFQEFITQQQGQMFATPSEALQFILKEQETLVLIIGSLYLVGDVMSYMQKEVPF